MKLRQKLAVVLAATMAVTAVPVVTMAKSTNDITQSFLVAKDKEIVINGARPILKIVPTDGIDGTTTAQVFFLEIEGGEFLDTMTQDLGDIQIKKATGKEATVTVTGQYDATDLIKIPVFAKATGEVTKLKVTPENTTLSATEHIIAQSSDAKAIVSTGDAVSVYTETVTLPSFTLEEAFTNAFASADNQKLVITLDHDDYEFVNLGSIKAVGSKGFQATVDVNAQYGKYGNNDDRQILEITLDKEDIKNAVARGKVVISGVQVKATNKAPETGDLNVTLSGKLVSEKQYKVGNVTEYGVTFQMKDNKPVEITAGKDAGVEIFLKENIDDSIVGGRMVEVRLEDGYFVTSGSQIKVNDRVITESEFIKETVAGEKRVVGFEVKLESKDTADKKVKDEYKFTGKIAAPLDFTGEIKVTANGRAIGEEFETVAATVKAPIQVETEAAVLKVGLKDQKAGKIVVTETEKGMLAKGKKLEFDLADDKGITFTGKPEVKVTGDIVLGEIALEDGKYTVEVKRASKEASTIEITGFGIKLDRTVPEGTYGLTIGGDAVAPNKTTMTVKDFFVVGTPNTEDITNGMRKGIATFANGAAAYTVNGVEKQMDAAAYISTAGRMMLPVRYVSEAFGIDGNNVIFADGTVTILAGTRTLQVKNGSDVAVLNGVSIKMAEKVVIKDGRAYVPVGEVGRLLGVSVSFDSATKTATFENK